MEHDTERGYTPPNNDANPVEQPPRQPSATTTRTAEATTPTSANTTPSTQPSGPPSAVAAEGASRRTLTPLAGIGIILLGLLLLAIIFFAGRASAPTETTEQSVISAIDQVDPSVVQVQSRGSAGKSGVGSGEILTSSGYIVTNSHVVHGMNSYTVLLSSGDTISAQLIADVPSQDLAVLKISASNLKPIAVADSSQVQVGQFAVAMGSPLGLEQSASSGIISALNREGREVVDGKAYTLTGMIQTSAPINPGNSGGALINLDGQLVGIPTLAAVDPTTGVAANGIGYAISSNTMESVVKQFIPNGG